MATARDPIDLVLLTHDRLPHLVRTVDALEQRTRTPLRITVVDNASGAETRAWLQANRHRFERLILRAENEHTPAFQHGIDAIASDPFIVSDPDLVVPESEPDWLERMLGLLEAHPEFGLIGMGLDPVNRPADLPPEPATPATADGELVEGDVGTWFQLIRREALTVRYVTDGTTCAAVRRAGWRVGWTARLRAHHLGWDDAVDHPEYLLRKSQSGLYTDYSEVALVRRPPTFEQLALAGPLLARTRAEGIADAAVLECAWGEPLLGAAAAAVTTLADATALGRLPDDAAGAVALVAPPARELREMLAEAARVARAGVLLTADLAAVGGRLADELAPDGWQGVELPATGDLALALARSGDAHTEPGFDTVEHGERWLRLFAAADFGDSVRRLWWFTPRQRAAVAPEQAAVALPRGTVRWQPAPYQPPARRTASPVARARRALDYARVRFGR